jgi:hypothetical protein
MSLMNRRKARWFAKFQYCSGFLFGIAGFAMAIAFYIQFSPNGVPVQGTSVRVAPLLASALLASLGFLGGLFLIKTAAWGLKRLDQLEVEGSMEKRPMESGRE